jgi:transposase InsO family protein
LITPEPKKRPKSSYRRFQADQPNECWQSDFTHWQLADSTGVEIINWLDDHSRYLLASRAYRRVTGQTVITTFLAAAEAFGLPHPLSPTTARSTPPGSPAGATASNICWLVSASRKRTAILAIPQSQGKICEDFGLALHRPGLTPAKV